MPTVETNAAPALMSEADQDKVREQMNRMLETHHFKHSRRYPPLLRFIVEETLAGRGEYLKERLLGVRVFDRAADYDTASDPIVRVTVAEIRKRIAQYYQDEEHDEEIRIELMPGRYAPEFRHRRVSPVEGTPLGADSHDARLHHSRLHESRLHDAKLHESRSHELRSHDSRLFAGTLPAAGAFPAAVTFTAAAGAELALPPQSQTHRRRWVAWGACAMLVVVAAAVLLFHWASPSALDQFWSPLLSSSHPILFCLPTDVGDKGHLRDANPAALPVPDAALPNVRPDKVSSMSFLDFESLGENIVYSDMLATLNLAKMLAAHHHEYHLKLNVRTSLDDLRDGPDVIIGGLDNQWTMRALAPLRYHFAGSDEDRYWVADTQHPNRKDWSLDLKVNFAAITRDYAIVARLHNEQTGQPEMIVAGIGMTGTAAAGEFLSDPLRVEELRRRIGKGFQDRDFEVVLGTDVVNGTAGSPRILAVSTW